MISIDEIKKNSDKVEKDYQESLKNIIEETILDLEKKILEKSNRSRERFINFSTFNSVIMNAVSCHFEKKGFECYASPEYGVLSISW